MEDLRKKVNFDSALLYYSTPKESSDELTKLSASNVETYNSSNRKHTCPVCGKRFFTKISLQTHMAHHPPNEAANSTNKEKDENTDWKNQFVANSREIKCIKTYCNFIALDAVEYCKHIATCDGIRFTKKNTSAYCELCDCYFSSENYFKAHSILQHPENGPNLSLQDVDEKITKVSDPVSLYVSENRSEKRIGSKNSTPHSMYPDSVISKKKSKTTDGETSSSIIHDGSVSKITNGNGMSNDEADILKDFADESSANSVVQGIQIEIIANDGTENKTISDEKVFCDTSDVKHPNNFEKIANTEIVNSNVLEKEKTLTVEKDLETHSPLKVISDGFGEKLKEKSDRENQLVEKSEKALNPSNVNVEKNNDSSETCPKDVKNELPSKSDEICGKLRPESSMSIPKNDVADLLLQNDEAIITGSSNINSIVEKTLEDFNELSSDKIESSVRVESGKCSFVKNTKMSEDKTKLDPIFISSEGEYYYPPPNIAAATSESSAEDEILNNLLPSAVTSNQSDEKPESHDAKCIRPIPTAFDKNVTDPQPSHTSKAENPNENDNTLKQSPSEILFAKITADQHEEKTNILATLKQNAAATTSTVFVNRPELEQSNPVRKKMGRPPKKKTIIIDGISSSSTTSKITQSHKNREENESYVRKSKSASHDNDDLNIKQRSVRQRKKLILPDYEYGLDHKAEFSDSSATENTSLMSMGETESTKKRGRPRKRRVENSNVSAVHKKYSSTVSLNKKNLLSAGSNKFLKTDDEIDEQAEEFCLNTTINESESDIGFNDSYSADISYNDSKLEGMMEEDDDDDDDDRNNDIHSWLKKVDFSEHSAFDSWCDKTPKKRLGRPPKKKKQLKTMKLFQKSTLNKPENPANISDIHNGNLGVVIKKKKGRPSLKDKQRMLQVGKKGIHGVNNYKMDSNDKITGTYDDVSPKKRGRPSKVKPTTVTDMNHIQSNDSVSNVEMPSNIKQIDISSKHEANDVSHDGDVVEIIVVKKRGRPRKSVNIVTEVENLEPPCLISESGGISEVLLTENDVEEKLVLDEKLDDVENCSDPIAKSEVVNVIEKDSTSKNPPPKKRGRPPKLETLNMKKREADASDKTPRQRKQMFEGKIVSCESDMSFSMDTHAIHEVHSEDDMSQTSNNENLFKKLYDGQKSAKRSLLKTKVSVKHESPVEEKSTPDETIQIDEELYHADLRNKSRFSRVFKKPVINLDDQPADSVVVCGRCEKKMTKLHYFKYHQVSHYYLCWLEGEPKINLSDDVEMSKIIQSYISPDALKKKAIRLSCELCDKTMKSVVGYVSHVRFCQKKGEEELFEKCTLCTRLLKPSSIRHHYVKYHGVTKFITTSESKIIPASCSETKMEFSASLMQDKIDMPAIRKNLLMGFERVPIQKVDVLNDEHFWKSLKTSYDLYMCMGLSCRHMTLGKDDLKTHILSCSASFCEFSCSSCPYKTKYESEIIYHSKKKCKETSDSEDNAEEKSQLVPDRRISTRVKKRKPIFDYDDYIDVDRKKRKDADFKPSESDSFDEDESDESDLYILKEKKSRFNKKKIDSPLNKGFEDGGLRQTFIFHQTTRNFDPLSRTVDVRLKTFSTCPVHINLRVDINEWETFPISDLPKYSPLQHKSPKVSFDGTPFAQFKLFDSDVIKGVPVCYTGGPVWSMAWAPLPAHVTEQYLAVSGLQHMNHLVDLNTPVAFPSLVQIWKFSSLDNISNEIHPPTLAWAVAHNFGAVWSMEWCPSGGFDNSSTPYRLGILALATSSGCCVIYSMPRLDCGGETRSIVANPEPDLTLKVRCDNVQCTRIVWKRNYLPNTIFGGFSDGTVALWNISSTSSILKKGKVLYPYRTFEAHSGAITVLDVHWLDNCRFMLTSSFDRILKYWDLEDLSGPMYEFEFSNSPTSAAWMHHWIVSIHGMDFTNTIEPTSTVIHPRDLVEKRKPILNIKDTFWVLLHRLFAAELLFPLNTYTNSICEKLFRSVAYSDWNDTIAVSSQGGCVSVLAAKHMSTLTWKLPDFEKIVTQTVLTPLSDNDKDKLESVEASTGLPPTNDSFDCSSIIENYGLKFCDRLKTKPNADGLNFSIHEANVTSANKVCWNQNYNSFNWLAVGYESGFVRVIRVERFDKSHLTKFYKLNENNTITSI